MSPFTSFIGLKLQRGEGLGFPWLCLKTWLSVPKGRRGSRGDDFGEVPGLLPECEDLSHSPRSLVDFTSFHQQEAVVPSGFFFLWGCLAVGCGKEARRSQRSGSVGLCWLKQDRDLELSSESIIGLPRGIWCWHADWEILSPFERLGRRLCSS